MLHFRFDMPLYLMSLYGTIMIVLVLFFRAILKDKLPKLVFPILWSMVLLRLLLPFALSGPFSVPVPALFENMKDQTFAEQDAIAEEVPFKQPEQVTSSNAAATTEESGIMTSYAYTPEAADSGLRIFDLLTILFFSGLVITLGILLYQKFRYSRRLRDCLLLEHNETINEILREKNMGHILVFSNDNIASPLVCGLIHPCIYLPTRMDFGNPELLCHILSHETMHIKRKDNWLKALMLLALCLNWYNPLVWIMSKCLAADLETACDAAVLANQDMEYKKSYAASLLAMAIAGNRSTLLYSAFSKTEVEKRIHNVLNYRKAGVLGMVLSITFLSAGALVFAAGGQASFSPALSSYCASDTCKWGIKAELTRDIFKGENYQNRADDIILSVLSSDTGSSSAALEKKLKAALAEEFHVEASAFHLDIFLCLSPEAQLTEYKVWDIQAGKDGFYLYKGQTIRTFTDEMPGCYQAKEEGIFDIIVNRNKAGEIISLTTLSAGDPDYDSRTLEIERDRQASKSNTKQAVETAVSSENVFKTP